MKLLNYLSNSEDYHDEGKLISKESIQRSDDYCIQYGKWVASNKQQPILQEVYEAFLNQEKSSKIKDAAISFLMIPKINGFTLKYDSERWEEVDFMYLFEYVVLTLMKDHGFDKICSIKEVTQYFDRVETIERYKLKNTNQEVDYSEILVRLCFVNNKISSIKFCATCTEKRITNLSGLIKKIANAGTS